MAPIVHHPPEWPVYTADEVAGCANLIRSGRTFDYGRGIEIQQAEDIFSSFYKKSYGLALNSGTSALLASYYALGISQGDEVIVPSFTFVSTATPLLVLGATPILCDSGCDTGNVSAEAVLAAITPRTKAVTVTHLWGHLCDMREIRAVCDAHGLRLVEDCSHAHGASLGGILAGTSGDIAIFSVGGHKMISGGLGGILITDDKELYGRACLLANFQKRADISLKGTSLHDYADTGLGGNLRMSPMAALLVRSQMERLHELIAVKHKNALSLISGITHLRGLKAPASRPGANMGAWFGVNVRYDANETGIPLDQLILRLQERGLKVRRPHTKPLSQTKLFKGNIPGHLPPGLRRALLGEYGNRRHGAPVSDNLWAELLALPGNYLHEESSELPTVYAEHFSAVWKDVVDGR